MKAAIYKQYGPPEVVQLAEVEKPIPEEHEVLIKVHAATVNRTDCGFRSAEYFISRFWSGLLKPKDQILGNEFSGTVEAVGNRVTAFKTGDRVFGYDDERFGSHAEYKTIGESAAIATMPVNIAFDEAAAITEGAHYALVDIKAAKVEKGQQVLVNGATGGIGSAAVQLLKYFGAEVTGVCATPHLELVKGLGADKVIDYTKEDFTKLNQEFDFVFDAVGKSSFGKCKRIMKKNGVYISTELGFMGQNIPLALVTPIFVGKRLLFPMPAISKEDVEFLKELVEIGKFKPVIDRKYFLEQIVEAHQYVGSGQKIGNVLITM